MVGDRKGKMRELAALLTRAEAHIRSADMFLPLEGFDSQQAFADFVRECRDRLEAGRLPWLMRRRLQGAFLPTCDWDDCLGDENLGNEIHDLIHRLFGYLR